MLEYYENYLNNIAQDPNDKWRNGQQAVINRLFEDTTLLKDGKNAVEEESVPFDFTFHKIDAWVDNVTEATLNAEKDDSDYKVLFFKDCTHKSMRGRYYKFSNNYWVVYSDSSEEESISSVKVRRCNNILKWVDDKGILYEYPCVIDYSLSSTNAQTSRLIQQANSHITLIVQGNKDTLTLKKNKRIIINGTAYRFFAINNYMQNDYVDKNTPLLFYDFYEDMTIDSDNIDYNIADDIRGEFVLSADVNEIQNIHDYIGKLNITAYRGSELVEDTIFEYKSSDESVITIDESGTYRIVGDTGQEAEIIVTIKNNFLSRIVIPVRVIEAFMDSYTIKLSDIPSKLKQGDSLTIEARLYNHDEYVKDNIICTPNYVNDKYYTLNQIGDNMWKLTTIKPYSKELELTFSNKTHGVELTKSIKLTAMW